MSKMNEADIAAKENMEIQQKCWENRRAENLLFVMPILLLLFGCLISFFLLPKEGYSQTENRTLKTMPELSWSTLSSGSYFEETANYLKDHFPFRNGFLTVYSVMRTAVGNIENKDTVWGKDGYLFPLEKEGTLKDYSSVIEEMAKKVNGQTVVAVAGTSAEVLTNRLPVLYDTDPIKYNRSRIDGAFSGKSYRYIDLAKELSAYREEKIYFKTDHHWTSKGAYYASCAVLKMLGKQPYSLQDYTPEAVSDEFRGTRYNAMGNFLVGGETLELLRYKGDEEYTVSFCNGMGTVTEERQSLYYPEALAESHRGTAYDIFTAPVTTPIVKVEKTGEERPTMLLLKDSFAHSAVPFLAREYNIISVDIRTNLSYAQSLVESGEVDVLLVLVHTGTLIS